MTTDRMERIRERLTQQLQPESVDIRDDSHLHVGHAGARDGRGHYAVRVIADAFAGRGRLQRHRQVYAALGELMQTDIHALTISALTPDEATRQNKTADM